MVARDFQTPNDLAADTERDCFMTPEEGLAYGIVDEIVAHEPQKKKK